jgi:hypothetical protein
LAHVYSGIALPHRWRDILAGDLPLPREPLRVNFADGPDCVLVEVTVKVGPRGRILDFVLLDDGWDVAETVADGADTVELAYGHDGYTVFAVWDDDTSLTVLPLERQVERAERLKHLLGEKS